MKSGLKKDKQKLLILVDWFTPGYKAGGPIQSCVNLAIALKDYYDINVLTTDTDHGETLPYDNIISNKWIYNPEIGINIYYGRKKTLSLQQLKDEIVNIQADFVYLNHLFSPLFVLFPIWLKFRGKIKGKMIVCPRGALYDSALSLKAYKKKPLLFIYKLLGIHKIVDFHATNEREKLAIIQYFSGSNIIIADNLPNVNQLPIVDLKKEITKLRCIFIARIVPIKNLLFTLKFLEHVKAGVEFTIVGPVENENYWKECQEMIKNMPENIKVNYLGPKSNSELGSLLQQHHLSVLPTTGENFGHSIFESFLSGRPVLISDQTPWLNLAKVNAGWDLPLTQPDKFTEVIESFANFDQQEFDEYAQAAWNYANNFISNPTLISQYKLLFS